MLLRTVLVVLLSAVSLVAQTARDRISGDWGSDSRRLLELKFDGKQIVTGTVFFFQGGQQHASAPIKTGSFDADSGYLRLEGEVTGPDGHAVAYVIEGRLRDDALQVEATIGSGRLKAFLKKL
jgi:hypothetical protein